MLFRPQKDTYKFIPLFGSPQPFLQQKLVKFRYGVQIMTPCAHT
jgi:hypothetical protein